MKQYTTAIFPSRELAEAAIEKLAKELKIDKDDISYVYRNTEGEVKEVDTDHVVPKSTAAGATSGAVIGGGVGAALGLATAVGVIPVIGPVFAAGPIITALGIGGTVGTAAAGAVAGVVAGGLIGALTTLGLTKVQAEKYEDLVLKGNVLVAVYAEEENNPAVLLATCGATEIETISPA